MMYFHTRPDPTTNPPDPRIMTRDTDRACSYCGQNQPDESEDE